eukprot:Rhum_TRINITY_DN18842_c0_g1::Rhum_TRINITY_DN18842_c0_g1_i1::g.168477::m.168477
MLCFFVVCRRSRRLVHRQHGLVFHAVMKRCVRFGRGNRGQVLYQEGTQEVGACADDEVVLHRQHFLVVEDQTHDEVERNPEDVHDGGTALLGEVRRPHRHNRRPEDADRHLEPAEAQHLHAGRVRHRRQEHAHGGEGEHVDHKVLRAPVLRQVVEDSRTDAARDHEAGEHKPVGDGAGFLKEGRPPEHECVHGALEQGLHDANEHDLLVSPNRLDGVHEPLGLRGVGIAVILRPRKRDDEGSDNETQQRQVEGRHRVSPVQRHSPLREKARRDGHQTVAHNHGGEGAADHGRVEAALVVLADHPRLEGGPQDAGAEAAKQAAHHEHLVVVHVLRQAAETVRQPVDLAVKLAPVLVRESASKSTEDHGGAEPSDEERRVLLRGVSVLLVELEDCGALQPVRHHHHEVHRHELPLERLETRVRHHSLVLLRRCVLHQQKKDTQRHQERGVHLFALETQHRRRSLRMYPSCAGTCMQ